MPELGEERALQVAIGQRSGRVGRRRRQRVATQPRQQPLDARLERALAGERAAPGTDNAKCYTGHLFAQTLGELGARHIRIPPYTPRWNGKIERFFGTLEDEWAHGRTWPNSTQRDRALSSFLRYYNR